MKLILAFVFIYYLSICSGIDVISKFRNKFGYLNNTDIYLDTLQIIRKYGYPSEGHIVETSDGYLLSLHRIPPKKNSPSSEKKPPIFLQHGFLGSSVDYFFVGPKNSLPFLLSDLGYDVWLGNVRGNVYSKSHVSLSPDDKEFWNFTWHESAYYDIPASIDFILNQTNSQKIIYVGYSMGTTMFFVMTSTFPKYNEKIEAAYLMAPVAYTKHIKSPLIQGVARLAKEIKVISDLVESGELFPQSSLYTFFKKLFCTATYIERRLCTSFVFLVVGDDPGLFEEEMLGMLEKHYPAGYSAKSLNHYAQNVRSGHFRQYDYGKIGNLKRYGSVDPPDYRLEAIKVPMYFYNGKNDFLSTIVDSKKAAKRLSTLRKMRIIDYPKFMHLDFLLSLNVKNILYDQLISDIVNFKRK